MKKLLYGFLILIISIPLAFAATTPTPEIDDPISPVDAPKATITGTSEPDAKITVTGGPYQISPVYADEDGEFSVTVALSQESTNTFYITAKDGDDDQSDAAEVVIVEGEEEAQAYEEETGEDRTAPEAPDLDYESIGTYSLTHTLTGTGEADTHILVGGWDSGYDVDEDGNLEVEVDLTGNGTEDKIKISLMDDGGNIGASTTVYITSEAETADDDDDDDNDDNDDDDDDDNDDNDDNDDDASPLSDISGHWAEEYILALYESEVISGYDDGSFGPDDPVTRAQILKIAIGAFDVEAGDGNDADFSDVSSSAWYADYVDIGYSQGIVEGYEEDNTFRPDDEVTRAAALKIVLEAAGIEDLETTSPNFDDVLDEYWYAPYTAFALTNSIIGGYSDGEFKGGQSITRAEVCKIVSLVIDYLAE